ncbi:MAG: hypothetical protein HDT15_12010 [Oscillibacter sp.]|nr:hypothetical protein [Oscillibacter sp.]
MSTMQESLDTGVAAKYEELLEVFKKAPSVPSAFKEIAQQNGIPLSRIQFNPSGINVDVTSMTDGTFVDYLLDHFQYANNQAATASFFSKLNQAVGELNESLLRASYAESTGTISRNPALHGYLFEEIHAAIFNMRAERFGKPYTAIVKHSNGLNSVDICIYKKGDYSHPLQKYQAKCCQNVQEALKAIQNGDYRNQRLLVPCEQVAGVKEGCSAAKTVTSFLEYDGVKSSPKSYNEMVALKEAIQNGRWESLDWREFTTKDIALAGIASLKTPVLINAVMRSCCGVGEKILTQSEKSWGEIAQDIGIGTIDDTVKLAATTAVKVAIEQSGKEILKNITPETLYGIVSLGLDTAKRLSAVAMGKLTVEQATDAIAKDAIITAARITGAAIGGAVGTAAGGAVGTVIAPVAGSAVGSEIGKYVGAVLGGVLGEKGAELVMDGLRLINDVYAHGASTKTVASKCSVAQTQKATAKAYT